VDTAAASLDNVVALTDKICAEGQLSQGPALLERKRAIMLRAFELTAAQIEHDAAEIEKTAIIGEHPIKKRYEMLHTSEALRVASGWIRGVLIGEEPSNSPQEPTPHAS
jgi:hypothetical protein